MPQVRDVGLSPAASHRIELAGSTRTLAWPALCPSCGTVASQHLRITKVFDREWKWRRWGRRDADDLRLFSVHTVKVPFCSRCVERHREKVQQIGFVDRWTSFLTTTFVIPLMIAGFAVLLYLMPDLLGGPVDLIAVPTRWQAAVFAALAAASALLVWQQTRPRRVPPQTEVTTAFDFSDNLGNCVGEQHRVYAIANAAFAQAFRIANADRLWTDERRDRSRRRENVAAAVVGGGLLLALIAAMLT